VSQELSYKSILNPTANDSRSLISSINKSMSFIERNFVSSYPKVSSSNSSGQMDKKLKDFSKVTHLESKQAKKPKPK